MQEITYSTEKLDELFLTENVKRYLKVLKRLIDYSSCHCDVITDEEIEFNELLCNNKIDLKEIKKHVVLLDDIMLNYERIRNSTSFTVSYAFDSFISKINRLEGILNINTYLVIKGY